jgi:hypothetical protein
MKNLLSDEQRSQLRLQHKKERDMRSPRSVRLDKLLQVE